MAVLRYSSIVVFSVYRSLKKKKIRYTGVPLAQRSLKYYLQTQKQNFLVGKKKAISFALFVVIDVTSCGFFFPRVSLKSYWNRPPSARYRLRSTIESVSLLFTGFNVVRNLRLGRYKPRRIAWKPNFFSKSDML